MSVTIQLTPQAELSAGVPVALEKTRQPQYGRYLDELEPGQVFEHPLEQALLLSQAAFQLELVGACARFAQFALHHRRQPRRAGFGDEVIGAGPDQVRRHLVADDARHHHDEGAGRAADLAARPAQGRDEEAGDDGAVDAGLRRQPR